MQLFNFLKEWTRNSNLIKISVRLDYISEISRQRKCQKRKEKKKKEKTTHINSSIIRIGVAERKENRSEKKFLFR